MLCCQTLPVTLLQQNCSIVWCDQTLQAAVTDPGGELPRLLRVVAKWGCILARSSSPRPTSITPAAPQRWPVNKGCPSWVRTDFSGGDHAMLMASITQRLWPMGDNTEFIPGHGPERTFGAERRHNPYVGGS